MKNSAHLTFWKSLVTFTIGALLLFFNNCKGNNSENALTLASNSGSSSLSSTGGTGATGTLCEQDLKNLYARSWHEFLKTNCAVCHANGPGKGRFANADLNVAFDDFMQVGYIKVGNNAISPTHNPPYSGIQHTQQVNELKLEWQKGIQDNATCTGTTGVVPQETQAEKITLKTTQQTLGLAADGDKKVLTWTINTDLAVTKPAGVLPNIPGGKISITVTRLKNAGGFTYYTFSSPTLYGASVDTRVQGIFVTINGFLLNYPTTFSYVDKSIRAGSENNLSGLISTGTLVATKSIAVTDVVALSFININSVVLPPLPPPLTVSIAGSRNVVVTPGASFMDMTLSLSAAATEPVVVTLSENNDLCGTAATLTNSNTLFKTASASCLPEVYNAVCAGGTCAGAVKDFGRARSIVGATYNRFDWDYKFPVNSLTFSPGEQNKTLRIYFSKDMRLEKNRLLTFDIASVLGTVLIGSNKSVNYIINKYNNPVPDASILTFSELMNPQAGILGQNCVKCHNSIDNAGGYDMTDYELMLSRRVLIPRDVNSKMYIRMHPSTEFLAKPMPQDGFLTQSLILEVEKWILDGAKNN